MARCLGAQRTQGKSREEAIFQACVLRFRPITMTTMAALLGIAIVGGLLFSQLLTLYTTPVV